MGINQTILDADVFDRYDFCTVHHKFIAKSTNVRQRNLFDELVVAESFGVEPWEHLQIQINVAIIFSCIR